MNQKNNVFADFEELTLQAEHLVMQLYGINENLPEVDRTLYRLEKSTEVLNDAIKHGLNKLEKALLDIDYTTIQKNLSKTVAHHIGGVVSSMDRFNQLAKNLESAHQKTDALLKKSAKLIDEIDESINELAHQTGHIPRINRRLIVAALGGGFAAGILALYALSFITWLPQPYYATAEQKLLLKMVQEETLRIDNNVIDGFTVRVQFDTNTHYTQTGEK